MSRSISVLLLCLAAAGALAGEPERFGIGKPASEEQIAGWDIDVRPDGMGLPAGSGSVAEGERLYEQWCAECHGIFGEGQGRWPTLAGGQGTLTEERTDRTVGSYWPYLSTVWDYIHRAMPFYAPQSLSDDEVYAITAHVLYLNDFVDRDFVLDRDNFTDIRLPNEDGFVEDPRPDTEAALCMADCRDPGSVTVVSNAAERDVTPALEAPEQSAPAPDDAEQAGASLAAADPAAGLEVYRRTCASCHDDGVAGAPRLADKDAWRQRLDQRGAAGLMANALNGFRGEAGYMPPRGGSGSLGDQEVAAAVAYMLDQHDIKVEPE